VTTLSVGPDNSVGDPMPAKCTVIEVHVSELRQLFTSIGPSPFRDRDLDPKAEESIVAWAKDFGRETPLALEVNLIRQHGERIGNEKSPYWRMTHLGSPPRLFTKAHRQALTAREARTFGL